MLIFAVETCLSVVYWPGHPGHSNLLWIWMLGGGAWHHMGQSHWHVACSGDTWPWQCTRVQWHQLVPGPGYNSLILQANGCHSQRKSKLSIWNWILNSHSNLTILQRKPSFISSRSNDVGKSDIDQVWVTSSTNIIPLRSICPSLSSHQSHKQKREREAKNNHPHPGHHQHNHMTNSSLRSIINNLWVDKIWFLITKCIFQNPM